MKLNPIPSKLSKTLAPFDVIYFFILFFIDKSFKSLLSFFVNKVIDFVELLFSGLIRI